MTTKQWFACLAIISLVLLALVFTLLNFNVFPGVVMSYNDGISVFGLAVSFVAGVFTVWALYWAATEFSEAQVTPDLRLLIARSTSRPGRAERLYSDIEELRGHEVTHPERPDPVSRVDFGLILENKNPRAAQFVRITLRLKECQRPITFRPLLEYFIQPSINNDIENEAIFLQFGNDLVVYQADGIYIGMVRVEWETNARPDRLVVNAGLFNLVGRPQQTVVSHPINWEADN